MPRYSPQITISAAPGVTQYLRLALYQADAPLTEVASSGQLPPPHTSSRQLIGNGVDIWQLNPVIHLAKLFVTDGVSTAGTIIANFEIDPKYPGVEVKADWFIYADTEPGFDSGTNTFEDPGNVLDGWDYSVDIRGFGRLNPDTELDKNTPPGYYVTIPEYEIQSDELHIISFAPKLITYNPSTGGGGDLIGETVLITEDTALAGTDKGKLFLLESATSTLTVTLPEIDSAPANKLFMFSSGNGNHKNVTIQVEGSDSEKIDWLGAQRTNIILGQSEILWLIKWINPADADDKRWKVVNISDGPRLVGEKVYFDRYANAGLINCVYANGSLLDRDVYPRLWEYVLSLDPSMLVSDFNWSLTDAEGYAYNQGRFSLGDGSTTFRVPNLNDYGFLRGVNNVLRAPGSFQKYLVGDHDHGLPDVHGEDGSGLHVASGNNATAEGPCADRTGSTVSGNQNVPSNIAQFILIRC